MTLPTPHNNLFSFALSHIPAARSLIETRFTASIVECLDLDSLAIESGSFVDPSLAEKFSDVLLSVKLRDATKNSSQRALVYFLFEHKSEPDPLTVLQLLSYVIRIWEREIRKGRRLSPILPMVVYHGDRPWNAATSIEELIDCPNPMRACLVRFSFPLFDLTQAADDSLAGNPLLQLMLHLLKYGRTSELPARLGAILEMLKRSQPGSLTGTVLIESWIVAIGVYVMSVNKSITQEEFAATLKSVWPVQIEPGSLAAKIRQEGIEIGEARGMIKTLQSILGVGVYDDETLRAYSLDELNSLVTDLRSKLLSRQIENGSN